MSLSPEEIDALIKHPESEQLEFKEARQSLGTDTTIEYCVALANEGGGKLLVGVTDKPPRKVQGTSAFTDTNKIKSRLVNELRLHVEVDAVEHPDGRVLVFNVPSRPAGVPLDFKGRYWMRTGESLVQMTPDRLKRIFNETGTDYSAEICPGASLGDLDREAIENFCETWKRKADNPNIETLSVEQLLSDAELVDDRGVTYAALILLGSRKSLSRYLPDMEVIFEYRSSEASTGYQQRREYREGFFSFNDELWREIDARNETHSLEEGLYRRDIPTFDERIIREAILNAVCHRDYRRAGSTFVRQFPKKLEVESPGGFAPGVTPDNILWKQVPRNRRIAEALAKCGLVERSGQGARLMFERSILESKPQPDFSRTDETEVFLTLYGEIQDPNLLRFFEKIGEETLSTFSTQDLLVVAHVHKDEPVPEDLQDRVPRLERIGAIEKKGRGRGRRYLLSKRFYEFVGERGTYTRRSGLDRETNKALLLRHIESNGSTGVRFQEFSEVLPAQTRGSLQSLTRELKGEGKAHPIGRTRGARWYPGPPPEESANDG